MISGHTWPGWQDRRQHHRPDMSPETELTPLPKTAVA